MKLIDFNIIRRSAVLAWPIALQHVLTNLLSAVDVAMVSHLGDAAVGAVGLGHRFQFMILVVVLGMSWAVGILSAQFFGAGQAERIRNTIALAAVIVNLVLLPLYIANIFYADNFIGFGSSNADVIRQGQSYLWYVLPSLSFVAVILCYDNALRALNEVKTPMVISLIAIILNIALNFWLINGGLGVPALGVAGAAIATTIARIIQLILILSYLRYRRHILSFVRSDFTDIVNLTLAKKFLRISLPMMLGFGLWSIGVFVYQVIFGRMGTQELAVMSTLAPLEAVFIALFFGVASACSIMIGQSLGADKFDQALNCARTFTLFSPACAVVLGLVILALDDWVLLPFSDLPEETLALASTVLIVLALSGWLKIINMTLAMGVLRAGGDSTYVTYIDIIGMWVVSIPLTITAAFYFELPLIFVVMTTYSEEIVKAFLFSWRAKKKVWLKNLTQN